LERLAPEDKQRIRQLEKELQRKEGAGRSGGAADAEKENRRSGETKRMTDQRPGSPVMHIVVREAAQSGCRLETACEELGVSVRTFQ